MAPLIGFFATRLNRLLRAQVPLSAPTIGQVIAGLSALGLLGLVYVYGAAVMYFQLPSYDFLDKAFGGAKAWNQQGHSTIPLLPPGTKLREGVTVDKSDKTFDGFTLYTTTEGAQATLIDMRGKVVHHWDLPFSKVWSHPPHVAKLLPDEQIHWFRCYLYPNGDVLAVYHADGDTPYGYGLIKLDKDSKLLWAYANNVHHDVDVDEDGTIYTLTQKFVKESPAGVKAVVAPYMADFLVVLSPEGEERESIPILEALANSPYGMALASVSKFSCLMSPPGTDVDSPSGPAAPQTVKGDVLHTNSVKVLKRSLAAKFPLFKPGQVLVSMRNIDTIAVLDRQTRRVTWAAQGIWRIQHDAEFLGNGHLLLYDNFGSINDGTRVVEYDPTRQAVPWAYANENSTPYSSFFRGMCQHLPNGNTLILDPENRRLFEVTQGKELVWESFCPLPPAPKDQPARAHVVTGARRYGANELTFLKEKARARP